MATLTPYTTEHIPRGTRIPRLQEISFLSVTMLGVADGAGFEEIRQRLVSHMIEMRERSPGTGNTALFSTARGNLKRYVSNVSSSLKELMLLELVEKATVPSSARAAGNYTHTTFAATEKGREWAALLRDDLRKAYDQLLAMLWHAHPQFRSFLRALFEDGITVPLLQWGELPEPRTRARYVSHLSSRVAESLENESCGWTSSGSDVLTAVKGYLDARYRDARLRGREEPYPRNQDFVNACEEALVKFAFARRGLDIDFISHQIVRRWTKVLGVANFSYHVPRFNALRLWSTAVIEEYEEVRRRDRTGSLWVPIYRVRAGTCWNLKTIEVVFDTALHRILTRDSDPDIPFGINLDKAQYGSVPPSEAPLRMQTRRGTQTYYAMSLVPKRKSDKRQ